MLGRAGCYTEQCKLEEFIGVDFLNGEDLTNNLHEDWHDFNKHYIPVWLKTHPDKTKVAAGLACGNLWTVCKGRKLTILYYPPTVRESTMSEESLAITSINKESYFLIEEKLNGCL